ncbi:unnamed protein product, partial [Polarella glacialis]
ASAAASAEAAAVAAQQLPVEKARASIKDLQEMRGEAEQLNSAIFAAASTRELEVTACRRQHSEILAQNAAAQAQVVTTLELEKSARLDLRQSLELKVSELAESSAALERRALEVQADREAAELALA